MVTIRANQKNNSWIPNCRVPKWWSVGGVLIVFVLLNTASRQMPGVETNGRVTTKPEENFPKPDGTKDHNLVKANTTSFNSFSFYLMGDTPVSSDPLIRRIDELKCYESSYMLFPLVRYHYLVCTHRLDSLVWYLPIYCLTA